MNHQRRVAQDREAPAAAEAAGEGEAWVEGNAYEQDRLEHATDGVPPSHSLLQAAIDELDEAGDDGGDGDGADPAAGAGPLAPSAPISGSGGDPGGEAGMEAGVVAPSLPPGFADTLGLTRPIGKFTLPTIDVTATEHDAEDWWDWSTYWVANVAQTSSADGVHWSVATPPGTHVMGTEKFDIGGVPTDFTMLLEVDAGAFGQIVAAEQEHLNDYALAYELTIAEGTAVVNQMAESDFFGDTEQAARDSVMEAINQRLHPKLRSEFPSSAPLVWNIACSTLILGTTRDANKWHSAKTVLKKGGIDLASHTITHVLDFSGTQIGSHPSSEQVSLDMLP